MTPTTLHILGAGALGRLWAAHLAAAGWHPVLLLRDPAASGSTCQQLWRLDQTTPSDLPVTQQACTAEGPIEQLLIATKGWQTQSALESIRARLSDNASILVLQNGMGAQQQVADELAPRQVWAASTTDGAWLDETTGVHHAGMGITRIGPLTDGATSADIPEWMQRLSAVTGLTVQAVANIQPVLLEKVAVNSAINGLTALYNCANGELLRPEHWPRVQQLCHETEQILNALGNPLKQPLEAIVRQVLELTAANISSTCQDQRAGRPTELDAINGYLLREANRRGISLPAHQQLMQELEMSSD